MSGRPVKPTQFEVDALASFIEAAEELQQEPFFGPDEKTTLGHDGKNYYYKFGDRFHFRSALVSFRRIWLNDEASHFYRILNILLKYESEALSVQVWAQMVRDEHRRIEETEVRAAKLKNRELVDLWLNAVFAHSNITQKKKNPKRFDRTDFERYANELDYAHFEYSFRMAIRHFGLCYGNLLRCVARPILADWKIKHNLTPSFTIGAPFGRGMEEVTKDGAKITRRASSQYWSPETPEKELERLLARHEFNRLGDMLKYVDGLGKYSLIRNAKSYEQLLKDGGFRIEVVPDIDMQKFHQDMLSRQALAYIPCHSMMNPDFSTAIYVDKRIVTQQGAIDFFELKLRKLQGLLTHHL